MHCSIHAAFLATLAATISAAAQSGPTANQISEQNRREVEASRRESRENLERGKRGEIDPREVRRPGQPRTATSSVPGEVLARWQAMQPRQLAVDPDFVRAMQRDDPAALAHWEGVLMELNQDLRGQAGSRAWLGGQAYIPEQGSIDIPVREARRKPPRPDRRKPVEEIKRDSPEKKRNPMRERDLLERTLLEARQRYDEAMRLRDDDPGNRERLAAVERARAEVESAEGRYQAFLREHAPGEARARQQQLDSIGERMATPQRREREGLPPRLDPARRTVSPELSNYEGRQGTNPDHRLSGTPERGEGPIMPGRAQRPPAERPPDPDLSEYDGPRGTRPDQRLGGTPDGRPGSVLPGQSNRAPAPRRPDTPRLPEYHPPE